MEWAPVAEHIGARFIFGRAYILASARPKPRTAPAHERPHWRHAVIVIENARLLRELRERTGPDGSTVPGARQVKPTTRTRVADQVGGIERMSRLRRFLPPQVADLIVASGTEKQLESHRREITALFCDLRGFTGFTESADAEGVMALLRDYHAAISELVSSAA